MKPNSLFKLTGFFYFINGIFLLLSTRNFFTGLNVDVASGQNYIVEILGVSIFSLGIIVYRIPSFVGDVRAALITVFSVHALTCSMKVYYLIMNQAEGGYHFFRILISLTFLVLFYLAIRKES